METPRAKTGKRPDSQRVELLSIPENGYVKRFPNGCGAPSGAMNIGFKNISYTVREGLFRKKPRKILDNISGEFSGGELTAIMGPSGSGKTILMNVLAGYTTDDTTGDKLVNDEIRNENNFRRRSCYIMQDDELQPLLTVQEAMTIAADLKIVSKSDKLARVEELIESLGLSEHQNTRTNSLSGGQRKRLSIALELLKNPQVMFFDEPTSGLDSLSTKQCMLLLKQMALSGRTIICSIHQPSATIFEMFDHLYVLGSGKCLYQGSVKGVLPYLEEVSLKCPTYHNPADFLLEVASGEHGDHIPILVDKSDNGKNHEWKKNQRNSIQMESLDHIGNLIQDGLITPVHAPPILFPKITSCDNSLETNQCCQGSYATSSCHQLVVLLKRAFLIVTRDRTLAYSRMLTHTLIALFIGILYSGIGTEASNMQNNFNFMFFSVMFLMMTAFNCVTTTFPLELPIITREHFNKWYSMKPYFLAISLADIPAQMIATLIYSLVTYFMTGQPTEPYRVGLFIFMCILISLVAQSFGLFIGATMDIKNGVIFGPFCFLPFIIFSGFFVQLNAAHPYIRWIFHVSFAKYGFEGLLLSVLGYDRPKLPCSADYCHFVYPEMFLAEMDMDVAEYSTAVIFLTSLSVVLRLAAYVALSINIKSYRKRR
uniref:Putative ABCG protein n=1 Tax=Chrysomela populi TaxID=154003 RepID=A0A0U9HU30_CHRPP